MVANNEDVKIFFKISAESNVNVISACFMPPLKKEDGSTDDTRSVCILTKFGSLMKLCSQEEYDEQKQSCAPKIRLQQRNISKPDLLIYLF